MPCIQALRAVPRRTNAERRGSAATSSEGQTVAHIGARAAWAELHPPCGAERKGHDDGAERRMVGVHPAALAGLVLVDDALLGQPAVEERPEAFANHVCPAREGRRRGQWRPELRAW